ncbi:alpha/beta fold hydrolase [Aestuariibaculum marinum]|uniref:Alpha/beta hydrolase n=1 Tax=Aestuariibaculum marinum TaxID=2683592 RepID=A0A8J6UA68_9FLAO|nr:alpha/beta hydrolase [Aestuariibaculum marinum]MBD0824456.1 alpha/beta hydrolase [Aestuariibaculum marinum]
MKRILLTLLVIFSLVCSCRNSKHTVVVQNKFIKVNGIQTHYLDFGGHGMPVILVHSEAWDATTFKDFGPQLTDDNWVIAVTRPGYGNSGMGEYNVESQGNHLIAFLEALKIERAVFIANSSASKELTYLAENYSNRVAGVVYLSGPATPWLDVSVDDPYKASEMFGRSSPVANSEKNDRKKITEIRQNYKPRHYTLDSFKINVPALFFVSQKGREGHEKGVAALLFAGSPLMEDLRKTFPSSPLRSHLDRVATDSIYRKEKFNEMHDSIAKEFFFKLASDTILQRKIYDFHMQNVYPLTVEAQDKLMNAYGQNLTIVKLDVPQIVGYEYRDTPELIIEPIKNYLKQISLD